MHLALLSQFDARTVRAWSGIPFHIAAALRPRVDRLTVLPPVTAPRTPADAARKVRARLAGGTALRAHTERYARALGAVASQQVHDVRPDAVLSVGSLAVSYLAPGVPAAFWIDATFESNVHFYEHYTGLSEAHIAEGHRVEAAALRRADLAVYASSYAARSATGYYGTPAERVAVVPFGANLASVPERAAVEAAIAARGAAARDGGAVRLLFLGGDWLRKGGDVAVRVADALVAAGVPAVLDVVGVTPLVDPPRPHVRVHGFLRKDVPAERAALDALLAEAHLLVMPVRAEAFGCVFCEAAAHGVPSLSTRVGGVPSAVADGRSGLLFEPRPDPAAIAAAIAALMRAPGAYEALARSSRTHFENTLNWGTAADAVVARLSAFTGHG